MAKVNPQELTQLLELVGGRENIVTVSHCITRMRFVLNDPAKADLSGIDALPTVKGCLANAGQFQVVIGTEVEEFHRQFIKLAKLGEVDKEQLKQIARQNMSW